MTTTTVAIENSLRSTRSGRLPFAWAFALLLLIPIADTRPPGPQQAYGHTFQLFLHGALKDTQTEAELGYERFLTSNPEWAAKFQLLEARALLWRGYSDDVLHVLAAQPSVFKNNETIIESLTLAAAAYTHRGMLQDADQKLREAQKLCEPAIYAACGGVMLRGGYIALQRNQLAEARRLFLESLSFARAHHDEWSEASTLQNLGATAVTEEHFDEAVDWSWSAYNSALKFGAEDLAENALGNIGWAYYQLGDWDKGLAMLLAAGEAANRLGNLRFEIKWLTDAGYVYRDQEDYALAATEHRKSLELARKIDSKQDIINALEDLAHTDIMAGKLDEAETYLNSLNGKVSEGDHRLDQLDVTLARGEIAAARGQNQLAESLFHTVEQDPVSQTSMRLGAEHQLARLYEAEGNTVTAESMYRTALTTFETARDDLKNEDSKLPFLVNATPIYDDYIHFLVKQGRAEEALATADQSRARTLAQGLGVETKPSGKASLRTASLGASDVARKSDATVLFYWLGKQQSYLWAITPKKTSLFMLPAQREIAPMIERYRKELLQPAIGREVTKADGMSLYRLLVAPAADLVPSNAKVVVVCDGPLSLLNFETLVAPEGASGNGSHYWIEDANVVSAPSLYMLAAAKKPAPTSKKLLLMGDAVSPNPDYPVLPKARTEMRKIAAHFTPAEETVYELQAANSNAYLKSALKNYAYIHFVAHGVASRTNPLDSAIILSPAGAAQDSFKLYAREIIQHPIDARLVTVSACYGGGTRSYAGEGLVGLSWAFLRAGAHNVIGALWEASDSSTPELMDKMYAGLADGMAPGASLRQAKLALLHSDGKFRQPFYWAPFQLYAGM